MSGYFVVDVGGINICVVIVIVDGIVNICKYLCNDFVIIDLVLKQYFSDVDMLFSVGCIVIVCLVIGDEVVMINYSWVFF